MRSIDPNDPLYKHLTKRELQKLDLSLEHKQEISLALFGETVYAPGDWKVEREKRWDALLGNVAPSGAPYPLSHSDLLTRIDLNARHCISNTSSPRSPQVGEFANWVLRQYFRSKDETALQSGKVGELAVVSHRERTRAIKRELPRWEHKGWKLIRDGIRRPFEKIYQIPSLTVDGAALSGVPDLVFKDRTGRILIVEIKVSKANLPLEGWHNMRAQLWAYSKITSFGVTPAPEILLAAEVWHPDYEPPYRRKTYFWHGNDLSLNHNCAELFYAYGGKVNGT